MSNHLSASLQYGFLVEPGDDIVEQINKLFESDQISTKNVELGYYGTDGYCGLCVYAEGSHFYASYADDNINLVEILSMEKEFKETMEDFCREYELDVEFGWCLCANYG